MRLALGALIRSIAVGLSIAVASCRGGSRGWVSRQASAAVPYDLISKWNSAARPPPGVLSPGVVQSLLPLLSTGWGFSAAEYLAAAANAREAALPAVHRLFVDSLSQRFTNEDRTDPGDHPPLQSLRDSCFTFFSVLGPEAEIAAPELLELLRRRETEHEYVGSSSGRFFGIVLRRVLINRPDLILGLSKSETPGVRVEACRIMGDLITHRQTFGPVLSSALLDEDDNVVEAAIQSLGLLTWSDPQSIARLRQRLASLRTEWMREPWTIALRGMERATAKSK